MVNDHYPYQMAISLGIYPIFRQTHLVIYGLWYWGSTWSHRPQIEPTWLRPLQPAQGGILGNESHLEFANETLHAGDVAYFPNQRAYWFREATGKKPAETINVSGWSFQVLLPSGNEAWLGRKSPVNGHFDGKYPK